MDAFLSVALMTLELVPVPTKTTDAEERIRDIKDRPILRAAIEAEADILVTGDKDFLESGIKHPRIMSPGEFVSHK